MSGNRGRGRARVARLTAALATLALGACLGAADAGDPPPPDGPTGCVLGITYTPTQPVVGVDPVVRAVAQVSGAETGALEYSWVLLRDNVLQTTPPMATPDYSEVEFSVDEAIYTIALSLVGQPQCLQASEVIDVNPPGVGTIGMRVHVVAPDPERPPLVKSVTVEGGDEDLLETIQLPPAITFDGHLELDGAPVAGYVRFMPTIGGEAAVETYANALGDYRVKVRPETHNVLIVPSNPNVPPQIATWQHTQAIVLSPGQPITGTVNRPNGTPLASATVQLSIGPAGASVPSTIGTTDANGAFTLFAVPQAGGLVRISVDPPVASGLPRLLAESTGFDLGLPVTIGYDAALTTQDLAGTTLLRSGNPLLGADVSIVGTIVLAGSVTAGATQSASGEVRISAVTNATTGQLPAMIVPAAQLAVVVFPSGIGNDDHAITAIDLRTSVPSTVNAAMTIPKSTELRESTNVTALPGAVLDAVPTGNLALAGVPTRRKTADSNGNLTIDLAPNGFYQLRLSDPNGHRAALAIVSNVTSATTLTSLPLTKATRVQGLVEGASTIPGAVVQLLCTGTGVTCQGLDRSRPVAEGITGVDGRYSLAVPDPN